MRMSRYEAPRKRGKLERDVRVAQGAAESNSSLLSALELQTPQVLHISIDAQLKGRMEKPESGIRNLEPEMETETEPELEPEPEPEPKK